MKGGNSTKNQIDHQPFDFRLCGWTTPQHKNANIVNFVLAVPFNIQKNNIKSATLNLDVTLLSTDVSFHIYTNILMAYFHQWRWRRRRTPVWRVSLIITVYYAELFPLVWRWRWRRRQRLSLMVTVPILGMDLRPRDRSPSQFYYILIRGLESVSVPVEKLA